MSQGFLCTITFFTVKPEPLILIDYGIKRVISFFFVWIEAFIWISSRGLVIGLWWSRIVSWIRAQVSWIPDPNFSYWVVLLAVLGVGMLFEVWNTASKKKWLFWIVRFGKLAGMCKIWRQSLCGWAGLEVSNPPYKRHEPDINSLTLSFESTSLPPISKCIFQ
jgi:hypothetical protein